MKFVLIAVQQAGESSPCFASFYVLFGNLLVFYLKVSYCEIMCSYTYLLICKSNCMMAFLLLMPILWVCKIESQF